MFLKPIPVAETSKARSAFARLLGLRVRRGHECPSLVNVVCCLVEVSATG